MKCRMCSQELTRAGRLCRECERELARARHADVEIGEVAEVAEVVAATEADARRRSRIADPRSLVLLAFCVGGLAVGGARLAASDDAKPGTRSVMAGHVAGVAPAAKATAPAAPAAERRATLDRARNETANF